MSQPASPAAALPRSTSVAFLPALASGDMTRAALVLLAATIVGISYLVLLPPWQHYDEPTHFEYAWLIANRPGLPERGDEVPAMRREVAASMQAHGFYEGLGQPNLLSDRREIWIGITELPHPPAYFVLVSLPLHLVRHLDMTTQLYVARSVSVLLFVLTVAIALLIMRDLAPPGHALRWMVPLTVAMLPPFANHMTSVNNDVGAVFVVTLFLWGAVRSIRYGLSWQRLLWLVGSALLSVLVKNTAAITLPLAPLVIVLAVWVQRGWRWRWFWLGTAILVIVPLLVILERGDAAFWYRRGSRVPGEVGTRQLHEAARSGDHVLSIMVTRDDVSRSLVMPLRDSEVRRLAGQTVTLGGWLWADQEAELNGPGLMIGESRPAPSYLTKPVRVSPDPTFVTATFTIPQSATVVYYALYTSPANPPEAPFYLYLEDAFLVEGELQLDERTGYPSKDAALSQNLLRNPGAETEWVRVRSSVDGALLRYARRSPSYMLAALLDVEHSMPLLTARVAPWLLDDFFSAFAWGHVRLSGLPWVWMYRLVVVLSLTGVAIWLLKRRATGPSVRPALAFLGLFALGICLNALIWPLPFPVPAVTLPSARYVYPAIVPIALVLAGGWWGLWPQRLRSGAVALWLLGLLLVNFASALTIVNHYAQLGTG